MVSLPDPVRAAGAVYPWPDDGRWQQGGVLNGSLAERQQEEALVYIGDHGEAARCCTARGDLSVFAPPMHGPAHGADWPWQHCEEPGSFWSAQGTM